MAVARMIASKTESTQKALIDDVIKKSDENPEASQNTKKIMEKSENFVDIDKQVSFFFFLIGKHW